MEANTRAPGWHQCRQTTGYCTYCGAIGQCCRLNYSGRGCNNAMGEKDQHVCVTPLTTDLEDAYDLILAADELPRNHTEKKERHRLFLQLLLSGSPTQTEAWKEDRKSLFKRPDEDAAARVRKREADLHSISDGDRTYINRLLDNYCVPTVPELYRNLVATFSYTYVVPQGFRTRREASAAGTRPNPISKELRNNGFPADTRRALYRRLYSVNITRPHNQLLVKSRLSRLAALHAVLTNDTTTGDTMQEEAAQMVSLFRRRRSNATPEQNLHRTHVRAAWQFSQGT